jgi:hypothetical protein
MRRRSLKRRAKVFAKEFLLAVAVTAVGYHLTCALVGKLCERRKGRIRAANKWRKFFGVEDLA